MAATVLVVEDDPTMAEVLLAYLGRAGYRVEWCADGTEAAQLWQRLGPDDVILDIMLPGLSGLELLRRRRRLGRGGAGTEMQHLMKVAQRSRGLLHPGQEVVAVDVVGKLQRHEIHPFLVCRELV